MNIQLSERQQGTVAAAVTLLAAGLIISAIVWLFMSLLRFFGAFSGVFMPLAVAAILALVLKPYYEWVHAKTRSPVLSVLIVFVSIVVPFAFFLWFFGALLVSQFSGLLAKLPGWIESAVAFIEERAPAIREFWQQHEVGRKLAASIRSNWQAILGGLGAFGGQALAAGAGIFRAITSCLGWVVFPIYFGFFLMAPAVQIANVKKQLTFLKEDTQKDVVYLCSEFIGILVSYFRGQVIVAFCQGVLYAIGFMVVGLQYGLVLGLLMGMANMVPYLGSLLGLMLTLPLAFFQADGGWGTLLAVVAVIVVVQAIEGYVLTPRVMGERTGLHPVVIMVAMFFWGSALGGIGGMILAIPLTAFLVVFWRLVKEKYLKAVV